MNDFQRFLAVGGRLYMVFRTEQLGHQHEQFHVVLHNQQVVGIAVGIVFGLYLGYFLLMHAGGYVENGTMGLVDVHFVGFVYL